MSTYNGYCYTLDQIPDGIVQRTEDNCKDRSILKWSGSFNIPKVGDTVLVTMNGLGKGVVIGYFYEIGFFGCRIQLSDPPDWYVKQNKDTPPKVVGACIYGTEMTPLEEEVKQPS